MGSNMSQFIYAGVCFFICVSVLTLSYNSAEDRQSDVLTEMSRNSVYPDELKPVREQVEGYEDFDNEAKLSVLVKELKRDHRIKVGSELESIDISNFRAWLMSQDKSDINIKGSIYASELIKMNRLDLFDELLKMKVSLNQADEEGNTPIFYSIAHGDHSLVSRVLQENIDINHLNKVGESPLHWAVSKGDKSLFISLIERGANYRVKSQHPTVFHRAIIEDKIEIVQELVWRFPHLLYLRDQDGQNPLVIARENGSLNSYEFLLDLKKSAKNMYDF